MIAAKLYRYSRNALAILGLFSILAAGAYFALESFFTAWGTKTVLKTATAADSSVKATLYQIDAGAAGATRTYVALSNSRVDGSSKGNVVLTFLNLGNVGEKIHLDWKTNLLLVVTYPAGGEVEYSVSKTRGIMVEAVPD